MLPRARVLYMLQRLHSLVVVVLPRARILYTLQRLHSVTLLYREEEEVSSCAGIIYTTIPLHSKSKKDTALDRLLC